MTSEPVLLSAIILVSLTSVFILMVRDCRYCVGALAVQYIGVFLLVYPSWPVEMAVAKMVAGWMAGAILGIAMTISTGVWQESEKSPKFDPIFRFFASLIIALTVTSLVLHSDAWLFMIDVPIRWGSFILISFGLLQLSLTTHPLRIFIGLLTSLSGFEILYAALEMSTLVTGLLAGITLGLALVGAYILIAPTMESTP
jgi:hypothetical protein